MKKTEFKPNYDVHPLEIVADMALHKLLTSEWVERLEMDGITKKDAMLLGALFGVDRSFFNNLQENYNKDKEGLTKSISKSLKKG